MRPCIDTVIEEHGQDPVPAAHERKAAPPPAPVAEGAGPEPKPAARVKIPAKAKE